MWEVKAAELLKSSTHKGAIDKIGESGRGNVLRLPRFGRVRPDKKPEEGLRVIRSWKCTMLRILLLEVVAWIWTAYGHALCLCWGLGGDYIGGSECII